MKVLGFCAGRKNGNTEIMMKEAFMAIKEKCDAECQLVRIQDTFFNTCTGCEACMIHHIKGDYDFRCVHKKESDHFYFLEQLLREADAVIFSTPAYNLLPTGQLIKFMNKLHASGDYRKVFQQEPKIGACFSIGGTDWTNYTPDMIRLMTQEFCGSYDTIVDSCHIDFINANQMVLLFDDVLARMRQLGENVADALLEREKGAVDVSYKGDKGLCPYCHTNLIEKRVDGYYCPTCLVKADLSIVDGELIVDFTPKEMEKSRFAPWGQKLHLDNIAKGHKKAAMGKETIAEKRGKYLSYDCVVKLPELIKE